MYLFNIFSYNNRKSVASFVYYFKKNCFNHGKSNQK